MKVDKQDLELTAICVFCGLPGALSGDLDVGGWYHGECKRKAALSLNDEESMDDYATLRFIGRMQAE